MPSSSMAFALFRFALSSSTLLILQSWHNLQYGTEIWLVNFIEVNWSVKIYPEGSELWKNFSCATPHVPHVDCCKTLGRHRKISNKIFSLAVLRNDLEQSLKFKTTSTQLLAHLKIAVIHGNRWQFLRPYLFSKVSFTCLQCTQSIICCLTCKPLFFCSLSRCIFFLTEISWSYLWTLTVFATLFL